MSPANAWNLDQSKILSCGKELKKTLRRKALKALWIKEKLLETRDIMAPNKTNGH